MNTHRWKDFPNCSPAVIMFGMSITHSPADVISQRLADSQTVLAATREHLGGRIQQAAEVLIDCFRSGGGVLLFGNGGSAADAQHLAGELVGRFLSHHRKPLRAISLSSDPSVVSSLANDFGYEQVFARQLRAHARPGDVAWALSTSGNSPNVLAALQAARELNLPTLALTGRAGGQCADLADVLLDIPSNHTPHVQEAGLAVYHVLCELIDNALAEAPPSP